MSTLGRRRFLSHVVVTLSLSLAWLFAAPARDVCAQKKKNTWELSPENITRAINEAQAALRADPSRPGFHLTPPAGSMGDPNGGIFHDGWYHIFYGLQPFSAAPGGWYWAHARSKDLLRWEHLKHNLTPAAELGLNGVGSGSTVVTDKGEALAFYSTGTGGAMKFWRARFSNRALSEWKHPGKNPVLTLEAPGLPRFDGFWRDPFVFKAGGRTFLIACADLLDDNYVPVPIFEAKNADLTEWDYRGILFVYPKHKLRNLEVPELRPLGNKWILLASADAPVDRVVYFIGDFDLQTLKFTPVREGNLDHSGHYYAQETLLDGKGNLHVMAWMPGWDRPWLPNVREPEIKNTGKLWNGAFALPRKLSLGVDGALVQQPIDALKQLRTERRTVGRTELPVRGAMAAFDVLPDIRGNQLELEVEFDLHAASFCGLNLLADDKGQGGLYIVWSGNVLDVDGVKVPLPEWKPGVPLKLRIFVDKQFVEVFVNDGRHTVSRRLREENVKGDRIALTRLGGRAILNSMQAWTLKTIN